MAKKKNYLVTTFGHEVLRQKAAPIENIDESVRQLAADMIETTRVFDGVGLAGPQVGVSKRIVVLDVPDYPEYRGGSVGEALLLPQMPVVLINPEIISYGDTFNSLDEGCLSIPGIFGPVIRPASIFLRATLLDGKTIECECAGFLARAIQHEFDHLKGFMFVDRMTEDARKYVNFKLNRLEKSGKKNNFERKCEK